jgi:hypothetical protein
VTELGWYNTVSLPLSYDAEDDDEDDDEGSDKVALKSNGSSQVPIDSSKLR